MVYEGMTSTMSNMYITEKHVVRAGVTSHSSKKKNTKRASHINVPFSILFSPVPFQVYLNIFQQIAPFIRALIMPQAGPVCFLDPARTLSGAFATAQQPTGTSLENLLSGRETGRSFFCSYVPCTIR